MTLPIWMPLMWIWAAALIVYVIGTAAFIRILMKDVAELRASNVETSHLSVVPLALPAADHNGVDEIDAWLDGTEVIDPAPIASTSHVSVLNDETIAFRRDLALASKNDRAAMMQRARSGTKR